jgi:cAMP phosphodiesterase
MKLRILGCSGGIGGNLRTTAMLIDHDILIDSGMSVIDHVFVTHSHLDHIACLPLLIDSVGFMRDKPLVIHATDETLDILKEHVFNWEIWPDFTEIPNLLQPLLKYERMVVGETVDVGGRKITPLPVNHVVPAVGYRIDSGKTSLAFSGDTTTCDALWEAVNRIPNLEYLIVETAFSNAEKQLAVVSKHLCPSLLADELRKLKLNPKIYITHLKPGEVELTMQEISDCVQGSVPKMLQNGQVFEF